MEILKILTESGENLYKEDLDFFETELDTGEYEDEYKKLCMVEIQKLRNWFSGVEVASPVIPKTKNSGSEKKLVMGLADIAPDKMNPALLGLSDAQIVAKTIEAMRFDSTYKTSFKNYIKSHPEIDGDFIDHNYSMFTQWEIDLITTVRQLGEPFLEKYFGALNLEKVAKYQCFSEAFFMKHYSQLDEGIVLQKGKNDWRKKENRSTQLDVFLRLKGVKI